MHEPETPASREPDRRLDRTHRHGRVVSSIGDIHSDDATSQGQKLDTYRRERKNSTNINRVPPLLGSAWTFVMEINCGFLEKLRRSLFSARFRRGAANAQPAPFLVVPLSRFIPHRISGGRSVAAREEIFKWTDSELLLDLELICRPQQPGSSLLPFRGEYGRHIPV